MVFTTGSIHIRYPLSKLKYFQSEDKLQIEKEVSKMIQECQDTIAEIDYILALIEMNGCE